MARDTVRMCATPRLEPLASGVQSRAAHPPIFVRTPDRPLDLTQRLRGQHDPLTLISCEE